MAPQKPTIVFGTAGVAAFSTEDLNSIFSILEKHNVKDLDTAYIYPSSEETLGKAGAPEKFTISTKAPGFAPGAMTKQNLLDGLNKGLQQLGVSSVDIYYLHAPDPSTPIEETLSAVQQLYSEGKFKRFGLSNFKAPDVQKIYDIQASANSVLPTVFQGNYNAVARLVETDLFPLLHKLKIAFYAYSPIAGGFLVKTSASLRAHEDTGRFAKDGRAADIYNTLYGKESLYQALDEWEEIAAEAGISKVALAYRWVVYHGALNASNGDGVIVGASKVSQLEESLKVIDDGPLDEKTVARVEAIWKKVEHEAPLDNYNSFMAVKQ